MCKKILLLILIILASSYFSTVKAETITKTLTLTKEEVNNADIDALLLTLSLGGARVNLVQDSDNDTIIVEAIVSFDSDNPEPTLETSSTGGRFMAEFVSGIATELGEIDRRSRLLDIIETWEITVGNYDIDTELAINMGGVKGDIDLGGMPITTGIFNLGGIDLDVNFSSPTTRILEEMVINAGGVDFLMSNIGNTDFIEFNVFGGGNNMKLDFAGMYNSEQHDINITSAGSRCNITVPLDAGEKVKALAVGALVSVEGEGWKRESGSFFIKNYKTTDYEENDVKLDFDITGAGSIVSVNRE